MLSALAAALICKSQKELTARSLSWAAAVFALAVRGLGRTSHAEQHMACQCGGEHKETRAPATEDSDVDVAQMQKGICFALFQARFSHLSSLRR